MGKLTKQQQQLIFAIAIMVFGGGYVYWNYMLKPTLEKIKVQEAKYKELADKIEVAQRQARRLPALTHERDQLLVELRALEKQLPKDKDMPNILRTLTKQAMQEDLDFRQLTPKAAIRRDYFEIIPFDLQMTGTLHSLGRFLASLGQEDRIFQAQNVNLTLSGSSAETGGLPNLNISLTIQTYAYSG